MTVGHAPGGQDGMTDPFALTEQIVTTASIEELAEAISTSYVEIPGCPVRFTCPQCQYCDHNGGSAEVRDTWRWWCARCRHEGTIAELRRVALESPNAVMALLAGSR
jgi:hypothetical protein